MQTIWILILFAYIGPMGSGNSNALAMQEFTTKARCEAAGKAAKKLTNNSVKFIEYTCTEK